MYLRETLEKNINFKKDAENNTYLSLIISTCRNNIIIYFIHSKAPLFLAHSTITACTV